MLSIVPQRTAMRMRGKKLVFAVNFVCNRQFLATFCATGSQYATAVSRSHTLAETMFVVSLSVVGLKCSFHFIYAVLF